MEPVTPAPPLPEKRAVEEVLRGAGLTRRQAKRLLSGGWRAVANDDGASDVVEALETLRKKFIDAC